MKKRILLSILFFTSFNLISQDKGITDKIKGFFSKDSLTSRKHIVLKSFSYSNNILKTINQYKSITLNKTS